MLQNEVNKEILVQYRRREVAYNSTNLMLFIFSQTTNSSKMCVMAKRTTACEQRTQHLVDMDGLRVDNGTSLGRVGCIYACSDSFSTSPFSPLRMISSLDMLFGTFLMQMYFHPGNQHLLMTPSLPILFKLTKWSPPLPHQNCVASPFLCVCICLFSS